MNWLPVFTVSAQTGENRVEVSIQDHGKGIATEVQSRLFQVGNPYSTEGTKHEKGTGLGLILCKDFVELCGGKLRFVSKPQVETTFTVSLPACS